MELVVVQTCCCFLLWGITYCIPLNHVGLFLNYMKCSTIGKFLVTICKNPIDVFLIHQLVKVCDVRHVAPSFFWWSTPLFLDSCSHCSPFFSTEQKKQQHFARVVLPTEMFTKTLREPRWKVLVRCHCVPSAIGSSRSDEIRIERRAPRHSVAAERPPGLRSRSGGPRADGEVCEAWDFCR